MFVKLTNNVLTKNNKKKLFDTSIIHIAHIYKQRLVIISSLLARNTLISSLSFIQLQVSLKEKS